MEEHAHMGQLNSRLSGDTSIINDEGEAASYRKLVSDSRGRGHN